MNRIESTNGVGSNKVDRVLREFFHREMPDPWPEAPATEPAALVAGRRSWFNRSRFAMAACIGLVLLGYLFLADRFPQDEGANGDPLRGPIISNRPKVKLPPGATVIPPQRDATKSGGEAESWGLKLPNGPTIINVYEVRGPKKTP